MWTNVHDGGWWARLVSSAVLLVLAARVVWAVGRAVAGSARAANAAEPDVRPDSARRGGRRPAEG